jgi:hypothetical protein
VFHEGIQPAKIHSYLAAGSAARRSSDLAELDRIDVAHEAKGVGDVLIG